MKSTFLKKGLSLLLALIMVISIAPMSVISASAAKTVWATLDEYHSVSYNRVGNKNSIILYTDGSYKCTSTPNFKHNINGNFYDFTLPKSGTYLKKGDYISFTVRYNNDNIGLRAKMHYDSGKLWKIDTFTVIVPTGRQGMYTGGYTPGYRTYYKTTKPSDNQPSKSNSSTTNTAPKESKITEPSDVKVSGNDTLPYYNGVTGTATKENSAPTSIITPLRFKATAITGDGVLGSYVSIGRTFNINWSSVKYATSYEVFIDGKSVKSNITGTSYAYKLNTLGKHSIQVKAKNSISSSMSNTAYINIMDRVTASFYDEDGTLIEKKTVDWNTAPTKPSTIPQKDHYVFTGWSPDTGARILESTKYTAQYEKKKYDVRFFAYNSAGDAIQIGTTQKVKYLESATVPSDYESYVRGGMEFAGWSTEFDCIEENTDVYMIEKWYNDNMKIKILDGATAARDFDGYMINCTLQNNYSEKTVGRVVIAIKTTEGKLIYTTESAAFTIKPSQSKNMEIYVPCAEAGTIAEIFAVERYTTALPISSSVLVDIDQTGALTNWSTEEPPADALLVESKTQYRYRDKETKLSGYSSLEGYERVGDKKLVKTTYSDYFGNKANIVLNNRTDSNYTYIESQETTSKRASFAYVEPNKKYYMPTSNSTYKDSLVIISDSFSTNANDNDGLGNYLRHYGVNDSGVLEKGRTVTTLGKIYAILWNGYDVSKYTTGANSKAIALYDTKDRFGTKNGYAFLYRKKTEAYQYTYNKWLNWSEWSDSVYTSNDNRQVETRTVYRYKANTTTNLENLMGVERIVCGKVDPSYRGREVDLFIYKYNEASDWTNEYIGQCIIGEDGSYSFTFKLRNEPSLYTGDFTATLGIEGTSAVIDISSDYEWLKAPLPKHTVTYYNADGTVISTQEVTDGENAVIPNVIPKMEGYTFVGWDNTCINVKDDMIISPIMKINEYTVTFIDWENQKYQLETYKYGDILEYPVIDNIEEGYNVFWDTANDGVYQVTENMVVCTVKEKQKFTVNFYDYENNLISTQIIPYGEACNEPILKDTETKVFFDWKGGDYSEVTENLELYPDFYYFSTVENPVANVESGEYENDITVTLSCATEGAKILYTLDGSDPLDNGIEYDSPFTVSESAKLKFVAVKEECNNSELVSKCYAINKDNSSIQHIVTISFINANIDEEKADEQFLVNDNELITLPSEEFCVDGFTLEKLYKDIDSNEEWDIDNDIVTESTTLYAKYSQDTFAIKFIDFDDTLIYSQQVPYYNCVEFPDDPVRDDFVFVYWKFVERDEETGDITYKACYVAEEDYTRVSLSRSKLSMITGSSATIKATVMSSNTDAELMWYSSNTDIATVDAYGNIKAVHSGTAVITVIALDTYETANCVVTVLGTLDTEILPVSNSGVIVDSSAKYLLGINRGENTINSINSKLQNTDLVYTNSDSSITFENNNAVVGTGCKIQLKDVDEVIDEVTLVIYGDVNGDGAVDAFDAIAVDLANNETYKLENEYAEAADATGDGEISVADYAYITEIVRCNIK